MGCSVGTVKSNTSRGLAALRASIGNVLLDESQ
jgi:DNA-directed RNA polymerase specialized sigma24 family protein